MTRHLAMAFGLAVTLAATSASASVWDLRFTGTVDPLTLADEQGLFGPAGGSLTGDAMHYDFYYPAPPDSYSDAFGNTIVDPEVFSVTINGRTAVSSQFGVPFSKLVLAVRGQLSAEMELHNQAGVATTGALGQLVSASLFPTGNPTLLSPFIYKLTPADISSGRDYYVTLNFETIWMDPSSIELLEASAIPGSPTSAVPEPSTWALLLLGLVCLAAAAQYRRKRRSCAVPVSRCHVSGRIFAGTSLSVLLVGFPFDGVRHLAARADVLLGPGFDASGYLAYAESGAVQVNNSYAVTNTNAGALASSNTTVANSSAYATAQGFNLAAGGAALACCSYDGQGGQAETELNVGVHEAGGNVSIPFTITYHLTGAVHLTENVTGLSGFTLGLSQWNNNPSYYGQTGVGYGLGFVTDGHRSIAATSGDPIVSYNHAAISRISGGYSLGADNSASVDLYFAETVMASQAGFVLTQSLEGSATGLGTPSAGDYQLSLASITFPDSYALFSPTISVAGEPAIQATAAVPEAPTWAMMLFGLVSLGYFAYRRGAVVAPRKV